jgi:protein-S-isoprenylcysteine O-methyltransferase Ste14
MFADKRIRVRSHVPNDARQTSLENSIGFITNILWLLALGYSIFLPLLFGTLWFYVGFSVFIFGAFLLSFATYSFVTAPIDQMIQKGVYSFSRHPMYLATFLICLGSGIATASLILIMLSIIIVIGLNYESRIEERYCQKMYRDLYNEYMNRVPRWLGIPK